MSTPICDPALVETAFSEPYSRLYDYIYSDKNYLAEVVYLERLFENHGVRAGGKLLDFGCGTGRHSVELAKRSWFVTGVDRSEKMLFRASERCREANLDVTLLPAIASTNEFDVAVSLFAVLNYLDGGELSTVLKNIHAALKPGGVTAFEVWNGVAVPFLSESRKSKRIDGPDGEELLRTTDISLDWMKQCMDIEFRIFRPPHEEEWFKEVHRMHYLTPQQFGGELHRAGFGIEEIVPAFAAGSAKRDDFNLIYVCRKGKNA